MAKHLHVIKYDRVDYTITYCGLTIREGTRIGVNLGAIECILCASRACCDQDCDGCESHTMMSCILPVAKAMVL